MTDETLQDQSLILSEDEIRSILTKYTEIRKAPLLLVVHRAEEDGTGGKAANVVFSVGWLVGFDEDSRTIRLAVHVRPPTYADEESSAIHAAGQIDIDVDTLLHFSVLASFLSGKAVTGPHLGVVVGGDIDINTMTLGQSPGGENLPVM